MKLKARSHLTELSMPADSNMGTDPFKMGYWTGRTTAAPDERNCFNCSSDHRCTFLTQILTTYTRLYDCQKSRDCCGLVQLGYLEGPELMSDALTAMLTAADFQWINIMLENLLPIHKAAAVKLSCCPTAVAAW